MNTDELQERLAAVEERLEIHAAAETPTGLTEPDPGGTERWEAGQVWAHVAEFPAYWLDQLDHVIRAAESDERETIPFGRMKTDQGRIGAIERDRRTAPARLLERIRSGIGRARSALLDWPPAAWEFRGDHLARGEITVAAGFERFIVDHLEEHADQLDLLARRASPPGAS